MIDGILHVGEIEFHLCFLQQIISTLSLEYISGPRLDLNKLTALRKKYDAYVCKLSSQCNLFNSKSKLSEQKSLNMTTQRPASYIIFKGQARLFSLILIFFYFSVNSYPQNNFLLVTWFQLLRRPVTRAHFRIVFLWPLKHSISNIQDDKKYPLMLPIFFSFFSPSCNQCQIKDFNLMGLIFIILPVNPLNF